MSESIPQTGAAAEAEIRATIGRYRQSINDADVALAESVWACTDDVSFIHPRGHHHGWPAIRTGFYEQTMGGPLNTRRLNIHDVTVHIVGTAAWAEFYWDFEATFRSDGTGLTTEGRETQVFSQRHGQWRLVHVHYSGMPVTGDQEGF